jgi:uncharacterized protein (DUF488 family)
MNPLFTIGHSTHELPAFLHLLQRHEIGMLADVRSQPYSKYTPWFNRESLEQALRVAGMHYLFLGRELGARRDENDCYVQGKVSYERIAAAAAFQDGLTRLRQEAATGRVALMCAEKDPLDCHRTILVARHAAAFANILHIHADGSLEAQMDAQQRLRKRYGLLEPDLFQPPEAQLAEAYLRRGGEIAYVEEAQAAAGP